MNFTEVYDTIQTMKSKLDDKGQVTQVFPRGDYHEVLCLLSNEIGLARDKGVHMKVDVQHGVVTVSLRRKTD